jgi:hypothetical protein
MNRKIFLLAVLLAACIAAPCRCLAETPAPVLKGIRVFTVGTGFGVEITTDKDLVYTSTKIPPLRKIIVDLPGTEPGRADSEYPVDSALISDIRFAKTIINDDLFTRIVINLKEDADYTASLDPADRKKLTVLLNRAATAPAATLPVPTTSRQPAAEQLHIRPAPPVKTGSQPPATAATAPVIVSGVSLSTETIDIQTNGMPGEFRAFTLRDPGRLVIDIPGARSVIAAISVAANRFGVVTARIGVSAEKVRLVFDAGGQPFPGYSVERSATGLQVRLKRAE